MAFKRSRYSEAVGLALRVTDAAARAAVDGRTCGGGRLAKHAGKTPVLMSLVVGLCTLKSVDP